MKRTTLPQRVDEINWLLSIDLTRYLLDNILDVQNDLEHLNVCLPVTGQLATMGLIKSEETDMTFVVISNNLFPRSTPLRKLV